MRVLHVIARINLGGTARWLDVLSRKLTLAGHEVFVAAGSVDESEADAGQSPWYARIEVPELARSVSPINDVWAFGSVRSLLRDIDPDIVNTHTAKAGVLGRLANASLGHKRRPLVHTIHGHLLHGYFGRSTSNAVRLMERELTRLSDLTLVPGERVGQELIHAGIVRPERLRIVHPGVIDDGYSLKDILPGEPVSVGWLARMVRVKRPDRLVAVARRTPNVRYVVGGDGALRPKLEAAKPGNVETFGWVNPGQFWPMCDMAILTSDNEAMPYSLIEAALAGLPAVTTDAGSASEVVVDGVTGFVVPKSTQHLADAVERLSRDIALRESMGQEARKRALAAFSPSRMLNEHLQAYEDAIHRRA
jgi:glycosyltransferase involved in cell wall biosynthesis